MMDEDETASLSTDLSACSALISEQHAASSYPVLASCMIILPATMCGNDSNALSLRVNAPRKSVSDGRHSAGVPVSCESRMCLQTIEMLHGCQLQLDVAVWLLSDAHNRRCQMNVGRYSLIWQTRQTLNLIDWSAISWRMTIESASTLGDLRPPRSAPPLHSPHNKVNDRVETKPTTW